MFKCLVILYLLMMSPDTVTVKRQHPCDTIVSARVRQCDTTIVSNKVSQRDTIISATIPQYDTLAVSDKPTQGDTTLSAGRTDLKAPEKTRSVFSLGTNLLYDFTYFPGYGFTSIPSVRLEYHPAKSRHFSFGASVEWPMWKHPDTHRYMQIQNIGLWARRYFKQQEEYFQGLYLSAGASAMRFGIGWEGKGWQGENLGASAGLGYKKMIGRSRFWFDTGIDLGIFYTAYDPYVYGNDATNWYYYDWDDDPDAFIPRNQRNIWFGPTGLYFTIGVDLFQHRKGK